MVKWGIIGLGAIAARFAGAVMARTDARIAVVASRSADKAARFAAACGATGFEDIGAMLATRPDVVYIASPHTLHRDHALACLDAGIPVLIEKPIAASSADALEIASRAGRSGVFAMEALWTRFLPAVAEAKRLVDAGAIGRLVGFQAQLSHAQAFDPASRFFDPALGGGCLLDLGVYPLSLALHFLGRPDHVAGTVLHAPTGVDRQASVSLRCGDALASIHCGFDAEGPNDAVLIGETGRIRLQRPLYAPAALMVSRAPPPRSASTAEPPAPVRAGTGNGAAFRQMLRPLRGASFRRHPFTGDGFAHQIDEVHRCLAQGLAESATMPLGDSVEALRIIEAVRDRTG
jgi:predicted dehydrogenase